MEAVVAEVSRLHRSGVAVEDAVQQANFGPYSDWTLARGQAPLAVRRIYAELDGTLK
jgi:hypothetical protein